MYNQLTFWQDEEPVIQSEPTDDFTVLIFMAFMHSPPKALFITNSVESAQTLCSSKKTSGKTSRGNDGWMLCYTQYGDFEVDGTPIKAKTRHDFISYKWLKDDGRFNDLLQANNIKVLRQENLI